MKNKKMSYMTKRNDGTPSRRKFLGFDFYIQCNEKLSRKNRKTLLTKSENYLGSIYHTLSMSLEEKINKGISNELDCSLTDLELLEEWNSMYERYGYLIPELKEKWEKRYLKEVQPSNKIPKQDKFETKINELEFRIRQLEILLNRRRYVENMG
ncbi:hypothetical protein SKC35_00725 [Aquirufa sp. KTFRIE-69F]|uniref:Uncharacterized protein n=1 Tax=Aquirufa originis TaxID=3096514 RepID=A0ABW6D7W3_9BACT